MELLFEPKKCVEWLLELLPKLGMVGALPAVATTDEEEEEDTPSEQGATDPAADDEDDRSANALTDVRSLYAADPVAHFEEQFE